MTIAQEKFVVAGPVVLKGTIAVAGAKNVALKTLAAALLTDEEVILHNIPHIRDVRLMLDVIESLGKTYRWDGSTVIIEKSDLQQSTVPLEIGARLRASSIVMGPLLARLGKAVIPNPGGCRIGARPINRHIEALCLMGADVSYHSEDGFFYGSAKELHGTTIEFVKNTHTGTETIILAAVLAKGTTVIKNAAEEVEIDDLIALLSAMGATIKKTGHREITIVGVEKLSGVEYTIHPDRNEEVTFAVAAAASKGDITVKNSQLHQLQAFLDVFTKAGGNHEAIDETTTRYWYDRPLTAVPMVTTAPHPGFMTDWQAPWALLMTQAKGTSVIHETVFENRFSYVDELLKMGADISYIDPHVDNPKEFYNFNWEESAGEKTQAIAIAGPTPLHNAIVSMSDLRAGATLLLASIIANGKSTIFGIEQIDRGYEHIEDRLKALGARIVRSEIV